VHSLDRNDQSNATDSSEDNLNLETVRIFLMTRGFDLGTKVLGAIVLWIVGRWVIGIITGLLRKLLSRNGRVDPTLAHYLGSILGALLNLLLILAILQVFGVQTTSFAALLAGLGLAIGTAWGGLLAHFAAGIFMQVLRPFKVGDFVMAGGVTGTVQELGLFGIRVDRDVTAPIPHRAGRAQLRHPVLHCTDSLTYRYSSAQLELAARETS
jgi:small-conductance mechanosensitive channel